MTEVLFKSSYNSRARTIKLANWDIKPEEHEPDQLEEIPCLDELENNELLIENVPDFWNWHFVNKYTLFINKSYSS